MTNNDKADINDAIRQISADACWLERNCGQIPAKSEIANLADLVHQLSARVAQILVHVPTTKPQRRKGK